MELNERYIQEIELFKRAITLALEQFDTYTASDIEKHVAPQESSVRKRKVIDVDNDDEVKEDEDSDVDMDGARAKRN